MYSNSSSPGSPVRVTMNVRGAFVLLTFVVATSFIFSSSILSCFESSPSTASTPPPLDQPASKPSSSLFQRDSPSPSPSSDPPSPPVKKPHYRYLIAVISAPGYAAQRKKCRDTWMNLKRDDTKILFMIGQPQEDTENFQTLQKELEVEQRKFGDIVRLNEVEHYKLLTQKMMAIFKWTAANMSFDFMLKTDDDSFVFLDVLYDLFERNGYKPEAFYMGRIFGANTVLRDKRSKWYEAEHQDLGMHFPPHASGIGYVLSQDLIRWLANDAFPRRMYSNEDAAVGTWLIGLKINRFNLAYSFVPIFDETPVETCSPLCKRPYYKEQPLIICHPLKGDRMYELSKNCYGSRTLAKGSLVLRQSEQEETFADESEQWRGDEEEEEQQRVEEEEAEEVEKEGKVVVQEDEE
eukprot:GILI01026071.1.p1 GENE.GILI01026071.1~~GILI01026071.1.p1  ORF type:complete len:407 (-),score=102.43 GILI01026071.1:31-1251(-)